MTDNCIATHEGSIPSARSLSYETERNKNVNLGLNWGGALSRFIVLSDAQEAKHGRGKCITPFCRRDARTKKYRDGRKTVWLICNTCNRRQYRERHPFGYAYDNLRNRARQRGHEFTLTLARFVQLFEEAGAFPRHNKHRDGASVDRIRPWEGYHDDNVQILTVSENSRKQWIDAGTVQHRQEAA